MKKKVLLAVGIASLMLSMVPVGVAVAQDEEANKVTLLDETFKFEGGYLPDLEEAGKTTQGPWVIPLPAGKGRVTYKCTLLTEGLAPVDVEHCYGPWFALSSATIHWFDPREQGMRWWRFPEFEKHYDSQGKLIYEGAFWPWSSETGVKRTEGGVLKIIQGIRYHGFFRYSAEDQEWRMVIGYVFDETRDRLEWQRQQTISEQETQLRDSDEAKQVKNDIDQNESTYDEKKKEGVEEGLDKVTVVQSEEQRKQAEEIKQHLTKQPEAERKRAYIIVDPSMSTWEKILMGIFSKAWIKVALKKAGYEVIETQSVEEALFHPHTGAVVFFGHGSSEEVQTATFGGYTVQGLRRLRYNRKYAECQSKMSDQEAQRKAVEAMEENFGIPLVINQSCYSLGGKGRPMDTQVADILVKPGGLYFGRQGKVRAFSLLTPYSL